MNNSNALAEIQSKYPNCNLLLPAATSVQINPFYKCSVMEVVADTAPSSGDIFSVGKVKTGEDGKGKAIYQILDIVEKYYDNMEFQEDNLYYQRFLTHLKYFAQRFLHKELHYDENQELFKIIKEQYREAYGCVKMIYLMMEEEYKYAMTEDEMLYLTIHIQKITEDHKRLKNL